MCAPMRFSRGNPAHATARTGPRQARRDLTRVEYNLSVQWGLYGFGQTPGGSIASKYVVMRLKTSCGTDHVLHIGGNATDARMIREALNESKGERYDVEWVGRLSDGLERLTANWASAVLLDLRLPDCPG